jgi:hypothetical protein
MAIGAKITTAPMFYGNDSAPFVYFDGCYAAVPTNDGQILLELAARTYMPLSESAPLKVRPVTVAHLRCSLVAARQLADALDNAIGQLEKAAQQEGVKSPSN